MDIRQLSYSNEDSQSVPEQQHQWSRIKSSSFDTVYDTYYDDALDDYESLAIKQRYQFDYIMAVFHDVHAAVQRRVQQTERFLARLVLPLLARSQCGDTLTTSSTSNMLSRHFRTSEISYDDMIQDRDFSLEICRIDSGLLFQYNNTILLHCSSSTQQAE